MAQIFRRRANSLFRGALLGVGLLALLATSSIFLKWSDWQTETRVVVEQPVPFSHQHHVAGLGIDCRYCHTSVMKSAFAGLPATHVCMSCHSQIWQDAPLLKPVRDSFAQGTPLRWQRVNRLPKFVYFNHSIHVDKGIGCTSCHGEIQRMPMTWKTRSFYMRDCLDCHREPERQLRPKDRIFDLDWQPPADQPELGARLAREYHTPKRRLMDCNTCHR